MPQNLTKKKAALEKDVKAGLSTCFQNLLQDFEGGRLSGRLVGLLVLLQHLVDLRVCSERRPSARLGLILSVKTSGSVSVHHIKARSFVTSLYKRMLKVSGKCG